MRFKKQQIKKIKFKSARGINKIPEGTALSELLNAPKKPQKIKNYKTT